MDAIKNMDKETVNIKPNKLKRGDEVRVIAPARSMCILSDDTIQKSVVCLQGRGLRVTFGKHVYENDLHNSASIENRIADLHDAFSDKNVKAILTVIGGFNSNQLLPYIDYDLISQNPKIICGYSDITALTNAIYRKTGLITYYGPHFSTFGMKKGIDYTVQKFESIFLMDEPFEIVPSEQWSDDEWYLDQENRIFHANEGYEVIQAGKARGTVIGGNLCTLNLLQGTAYMPELANAILIIEDDDLTFAEECDRNLESLLQAVDLNELKGILFGRFQKKSNLSMDELRAIISRKVALKGIPIMAKIDFGHTTPHCVLPIGGIISFDTDTKIIRVE